MLRQSKASAQTVQETPISETKTNDKPKRKFIPKIFSPNPDSDDYKQFKVMLNNMEFSLKVRAASELIKPPASLNISTRKPSKKPGSITNEDNLQLYYRYLAYCLDTPGDVTDTLTNAESSIIEDRYAEIINKSHSPMIFKILKASAISENPEVNSVLEKYKEEIRTKNMSYYKALKPKYKSLKKPKALAQSQATPAADTTTRTRNKKRVRESNEDISTTTSQPICPTVMRSKTSTLFHATPPTLSQEDLDAAAELQVRALEIQHPAPILQEGRSLTITGTVMKNGAFSIFRAPTSRSETDHDATATLFGMSAQSTQSPTSGKK